jgi:hypothetical protein
MVQFMSWPYLFWTVSWWVRHLLHHVGGLTGLRGWTSRRYRLIGVTLLARRWCCSISAWARRKSDSKISRSSVAASSCRSPGPR